MRNLSKFMFIAAVTSATLFTSCSDDDQNGNEESTTSTIPSSITSDVVLEGTEFILDGSVLVQSGASLTIPAGATIKATKGFDSYILVLQGGKIIAEGTESAPITFMSGETTPVSGDWGGLIINGYAPISGASAGTTGSTEINSAYSYGGTDKTDNSGSLKYIKLIHTGASTSDGVEHNGLTLNAVGNGTTIENIYVSEATDDAIEFFGGCVNVSNLLAVNSQDDMFDFTQGYCGTLTNAYGVWEDGFASDEEDPRGVEADGNLDGKTPSDVNQSSFTITNMTLDNRNTKFDGGDLSKIHDLVKVRRGATATINNALFTGLNTYGDFVDCEDSKGDANGASVISITNGSSEFTGSTKAGDNNATINTPSNNTGCSATIFSWTGYTI